MTNDKSIKNETEVFPAETAGTAAAPKAAKKRAEKKEPLMYVGPTVPDIGIQNRVYTKIPDSAEKLSERIPEIRLLFIPVKHYPIANRMLREGGGYIYSAYLKAAEMRKGEPKI